MHVCTCARGARAQGRFRVPLASQAPERAGDVANCRRFCRARQRSAFAMLEFDDDGLDGMEDMANEDEEGREGEGGDSQVCVRAGGASCAA